MKILFGLAFSLLTPKHQLSALFALHFISITSEDLFLLFSYYSNQLNFLMAAIV